MAGCAKSCTALIEPIQSKPHANCIPACLASMDMHGRMEAGAYMSGWLGGWDTKKVTTKRQRIQAVHQHNCLWNTQSAEPRLNLNFHAAKIQQSSQDSLHTASGKGDHERLALPKRPPCICSLWYVRYVEALPACLLKGGGGHTTPAKNWLRMDYLDHGE